MTRPTARVLALLEILQSGGTRTAADLAARLDVDERTLRRYVGHLIDLAVPVETVRGRYGGYRLAPGFRMPPLMLTDEEALAVLLGLLTQATSSAPASSASASDAAAGESAGAVESAAARGSAGAVESAAAKIRRVLPRALAGRLEALLGSVGFTNVDRPAPPPEAGVLLTLASAARDRRPVSFHYTARNGDETERTLHPYAIVAHRAHWYVTGTDAGRGEPRTFRLDRLTALSVRPGTFEAPPVADPATALLTSFASAPHRHEVSVLVRAPADEVHRRLPPGLATLEEHEAGVRLRLRAERLDWVPSVLAGLNRPFTVEHPPELRTHVRDFAARLATYGADGIIEP